MKFIIEYGCSINTEHLAIEADSLEDAEQYAYQSAIENREGYEGFHGVLDFAEYCEDEGIDTETAIQKEIDEAWTGYWGMIEDEIYYTAHPFDENNEYDVDVLQGCDGVFFEI